MGAQREASHHGLLDSRDRCLWECPQLRSPLPHHADQPARLANLAVAGLVQGMRQEQVTRKHGQGDEVLPARSLGPRLARRQKDPEAFGGELIGDQQLARATGVKRIPTGKGWGLRGRLYLNGLARVTQTSRRMVWDQW
jgi:hypothetical protein